jgi:hypothetical protein
MDAACDVLERSFKKRSSRGAKSIAPPNATNAVQEYVALLREAAHEDDFERAVQHLTADKTLRASDVKAIANGYRATTSNFRSKSDAISAIRRTRATKRRDIAKARQIRDLF